MHEGCLLPTGCVCDALSAGCGARACGARRRVMGTTRSYACTTQAGLTQLGSNVTRTSRGVLPVRPRRATLASLYPGRGAFAGQHVLQRCPQKPVPIPRSQLCSWNARRKLYQHVGNFVGSVISPILANIYLHELDCYAETLISEFNKGKERQRNPEYNVISLRAKRLNKKIAIAKDDERQRLLDQKL